MNGGAEGLSIIKLGTRRSLKRILFSPLYMLGSLLRYKHISSTVFYDIVGFASFVTASKTSVSCG